jgi:hypothetical protein
VYQECLSDPKRAKPKGVAAKMIRPPKLYCSLPFSSYIEYYHFFSFVPSF